MKSLLALFLALIAGSTKAAKAWTQIINVLIDFWKTSFCRWKVVTGDTRFGVKACQAKTYRPYSGFGNIKYQIAGLT